MVTYNVKKQAFQSRVTRNQQLHQHHHQQTCHLLPHPPSTETIQVSVGETSAVCISRKPVTPAVLVLVLRCKPTMTSTCMNFGQLCRRSCHHLLEWSRWQAAYPLLASLAQDLVAATASQAYVERVFSVMWIAYSWPQKQTV